MQSKAPQPETAQTGKPAGVALQQPCSGLEPPPRKKGWNHSEQVLAFYQGNENHATTYGIAYYHYDPPFERKPKWINFSGHGGNRRPTYWWHLPSTPNELGQASAGDNT